MPDQSIVGDCNRFFNTTSWNGTHLVEDPAKLAQLAEGGGSDADYWYIGVSMSICASILSNLGLNTQKYSMMQEAKRAEDRRRPYIVQPLWAMGLTMIIAGSVGDFAALGFAAQSLIAPVGGVTMIANLFFASLWLKEKLSRRDIAATVTIMLGVVLICVFASKTDKCYTVEELIDLFFEPAFVAYFFVFCAVFGSLWATARHFGRLRKRHGPSSPLYARHRKLHRFILPCLAGLIGAQDVLFAKCVAEVFESTIKGQNQLVYFTSWLLVFIMCGLVFMQIDFMAQGLQMFDATYCVPVFQCFFISGAILCGAVYFQEFADFSLLQGLAFGLGWATTLAGVYALSGRRPAGEGLFRRNRKLRAVVFAVVYCIRYRRAFDDRVRSRNSKFAGGMMDRAGTGGPETDGGEADGAGGGAPPARGGQRRGGGASGRGGLPRAAEEGETTVDLRPEPAQIGKWAARTEAAAGGDPAAASPGGGASEPRRTQSSHAPPSVGALPLASAVPLAPGTTSPLSAASSARSPLSARSLERGGGEAGADGAGNPAAARRVRRRSVAAAPVQTGMAITEGMRYLAASAAQNNVVSSALEAGKDAGHAVARALHLPIGASPSSPPDSARRRGSRLFGGARIAPAPAEGSVHPQEGFPSAAPSASAGEVPSSPVATVGAGRSGADARAAIAEGEGAAADLERGSAPDVVRAARSGSSGGTSSTPP